MEHDKYYTCKNCNGKFNEWHYEYICQHCDYGMAETYRDIDFNGTGYHECRICNGTGEESQVQTDFCCEECIIENCESFFTI